MTPDEEAVVEEAAEAIRRYEAWSEHRRPGTQYRGLTADSIICSYLEERGEPTDGELYYRLARAAAQAAWGSSYGRQFARPGEAKASEAERALRFYDAKRPSGRMLDLMDRDAA